MQSRIVCLLLLIYLSTGFVIPAKAESKLALPFKSPFSVFSGKKDAVPVKEIQEVDKNIEAKVEETTKAEKQLQPKLKFDKQSPLGANYAENAVNKAEFYIEEGDFDSAKEVLASMSEWVYNATEYHTDLFKSLKKVNNSEVQADIERDLAIQFAVLRDRVLFAEAKVLIANGKQKEAVENLVEVVRSQPGTELGFKAYKTLQDIGFCYKIEYEMEEEKGEN